MSDKLKKDTGADGVLNDARQMVSQLQEQAKNGQIDGAMLDQLQSMLDVTVDTAADAQAEGKAALDGISKTDDPAASEPEATSEPTSTEPTTDETTEVAEPSTEEESTAIPTEEESTMDPTEKVEQPLSSKPPRVNLLFDKVDDLRSKIPAFVKAMTTGNLKAAQQVANHENSTFDTLFNMSQRALLDEGGWTLDNLEKLSGLAQFSGGASLAKSITASTVPGIYLIKLAKLMLPLYAGLVNRIPAGSPEGMSSNKATWKAQLGYGTLNFADFFRNAEAAIGTEPPSSFLTYEAAFNDVAVTDSVTMKAIAAGRGYSDPMQISVIKSMSALLSAQEKIILGSNSGSIAAPGTVTVTAGSVGTLSASGSYYVRVTALTYEGWLAGTTGSTAAVGESLPTSSAQVLTTSATGSILVTWAAVIGAVAYNIYLSVSGSAAASAVYNKTVTINKTTVTEVSTSTNTAPASATTANSYGIEGLISWCLLTDVYGNTSPSKVTPTDNAGAGLTAGNGGITQFDTLLAKQWTDWKIAPSLMVMSPGMNATLVGKLQSLGSGTFYRVDVSNERNKVQGGMMVTGYVNKFAPFADGTPRMIDIIPHPDMPDGTILFLCETIPYPMGNESRGFVRDVLLPYTYFPLPSQAAGVGKIQYNYSITTSEVLECFNPSPQSGIQGIDKDL